MKQKRKSRSSQQESIGSALETHQSTPSNRGSLRSKILKDMVSISMGMFSIPAGAMSVHTGTICIPVGTVGVLRVGIPVRDFFTLRIKFLTCKNKFLLQLKFSQTGQILPHRHQFFIVVIDAWPHANWLGNGHK